MSQYRMIERGKTHEGIPFCVLENSRGQQLVSIDIEMVWKIQEAKQRRNATQVLPVGRTAYHKGSSKLRED